MMCIRNLNNFFTNLSINLSVCFADSSPNRRAFGIKLNFPAIKSLSYVGEVDLRSKDGEVYSFLNGSLSPDFA